MPSGRHFHPLDTGEQVFIPISQLHYALAWAMSHPWLLASPATQVAYELQVRKKCPVYLSPAPDH